MASPASSSSLALVPSIPSSINLLSVQAKDLSNITAEHLTKKGFDAKPWINYLVHSFRPQYEGILNSVYQLENNPKEKEIILYNKKYFESQFKKLIDQLPLLPCNGKAWKNRPTEIEKAAHFCAMVFGRIQADTLHIPEKLLDENLISYAEGNAILRHLQHLLLDRMSLDLDLNKNTCFVMNGEGKKWLMVKEEGLWDIRCLINPNDSRLSFCAWTTKKNDPLFNAVLIKGEELIFSTPFIGIQFMLGGEEPEVRTALQAHKPFHYVPEQSFLGIETTFCRGTPMNDGGNTFVFRESSGPGVSESRRSLEQLNASNKNTNQEMKEFTLIATHAMKKIWLEQIQTQPLTKPVFDYVYILPKTKEEANERTIEALQCALKDPEENASLIEYIAEQCAFDYSEEEIELAQTAAEEVIPFAIAPPAEKNEAQESASAASPAAIPTAAQPKKLEEIEISPTVMAHAVIRKLEKQRPAAQRPKEHEIQATSAAASSKRRGLSKAELKEQLSASSLAPKLKKQAEDLLSGGRLASKREEDKFFFEILSHQAKSSGSTVHKGNKGGSHHPIRLVRQSNTGEKITYRAATLVNKHGTDANRGHSLAAQQDKLLRLFTPLS
jgi:hypothetical protein